jgi:hypothetical protein
MLHGILNKKAVSVLQLPSLACMSGASSETSETYEIARTSGKNRSTRKRKYEGSKEITLVPYRNQGKGIYRQTKRRIP